MMDSRKAHMRAYPFSPVTRCGLDVIYSRLVDPAHVTCKTCLKGLAVKQTAVVRRGGKR